MDIFECVANSKIVLDSIAIEFLAGIVALAGILVSILYRLTVRDIKENKVNTATWVVLCLSALFVFFVSSIFEGIGEDIPTSDCSVYIKAVIGAATKFLDILIVGVILALIATVVSSRVTNANHPCELSANTNKAIVKIALWGGLLTFMVNGTLLFCVWLLL
ncbi:hypothetical protein M445_21870 [Vibrio owensii 47666-1]|uniref:hypothetical protein n=1 Tax=Vibrio owensii TaxID=696485 RepID=UPI0005848B0E|nr:hypothetical protein [Vibrio owensii]KIF45450.1 hypothetical protein M445_21870 [Vibrio owensii 47666-1]